MKNQAFAILAAMVIFLAALDRDASAVPAPLQGDQAQLAAFLSRLFFLPTPQNTPALSDPSLEGIPVWSGVGEIPNTFKPPAGMVPAFKVSYWSADGGFKNTADAPWNQGLAGQLGLGKAIFEATLSDMAKGESSPALMRSWNEGESARASI